MTVQHQHSNSSTRRTLHQTLAKTSSWRCPLCASDRQHGVTRCEHSFIYNVVLIVFVIWFSWMKKDKGTRASQTSSGYQEVMILVKGGYTPDVIVFEKDRPVRLNFRREETASCSEMVLLPDFEQGARLPTGETVAVEFNPREAGEFACQMGMLRGKLIVE